MKFKVVKGFISKYDEKAKTGRPAMIIDTNAHMLLVVPFGTVKGKENFGAHRKIPFGKQSPAYAKTGLDADSVFFNFNNAEWVEKTSPDLLNAKHIGYLDTSLDKRLEDHFKFQLGFILKNGTRDMSPEEIAAI